MDMRQKTTKHKWTLVVVSAIFLLTIHCKTAGPALPSQTIHLEPMLIRPTVTDNVESESLDVSELFERAFSKFGHRRYEDAIKDYETIVRLFPDSKYQLPSLYNAGLGSEKLERWADAAKYYRAILDSFPKHKDTPDAYFRLANAYDKLHLHQEAADLMTEILLSNALNHFDRIEAHVRRSNALRSLGNLTEAADSYRTLLNLNSRADPENKLPEDSRLLIQAHHGLGLCYHGLLREIRLLLPPERMGLDLREKATLFVRAQASYIRALKQHHPKWSLAAGHMIGRLYEDFYEDIFTAEIPVELGKEHLSYYFEELRKQIKPLMERAIQVYQKNLSLSRRMGTAVDAEWVEQTEERLGRLRAYLDDPFTQRRAEQYVVRGKPFRDLWNPYFLAIDHVEEAVRRSEILVKDASEDENKAESIGD
jgi:tetratricopeptide (TPR) repeat protein